MRDFYEILEDVKKVLKDDAHPVMVTENGIDKTNEKGGASDFEINSSYTKSGNPELINVR